MTFKVMDEEPNAPLARSASPSTNGRGRLLGGTTIKMPAVVGPLVGIKLVRGIKSALIKRKREIAGERERGRNLSSSFIA